MAWRLPEGLSGTRMDGARWGVAWSRRLSCWRDCSREHRSCDVLQSDHMRHTVRHIAILDQMNFRLVRGTGTDVSYFEDVHPLPGEKARFDFDSKCQAERDDYGHIASFPSPPGRRVRSAYRWNGYAKLGRVFTPLRGAMPVPEGSIAFVSATKRRRAAPRSFQLPALVC